MVNRRIQLKFTYFTWVTVPKPYVFGLVSVSGSLIVDWLKKKINAFRFDEIRLIRKSILLTADIGSIVQYRVSSVNQINLRTFVIYFCLTNTSRVPVITFWFLAFTDLSKRPVVWQRIGAVCVSGRQATRGWWFNFRCRSIAVAVSCRSTRLEDDNCLRQGQMQGGGKPGYLPRSGGIKSLNNKWTY